MARSSQLAASSPAVQLAVNQQPATRFCVSAVAESYGKHRVRVMGCSLVSLQLLLRLSRLRWSYTNQGDVEKYTIYRSINNYAFNAYRSVEGTGQEVSQEWPGVTVPSGSGTYLFVDHVCTSNNNLPGTNETVTKVRYKIMARHYDGSVSPVSSEVQINY